MTHKPTTHQSALTHKPAPIPISLQPQMTSPITPLTHKLESIPVITHSPMIPNANVLSSRRAMQTSRFPDALLYSHRAIYPAAFLSRRRATKTSCYTAAVLSSSLAIQQPMTHQSAYAALLSSSHTIQQPCYPDACYTTATLSSSLAIQQPCSPAANDP
jgi:hypothetical protein